jgi:protoporphyrinogen oxidase
VEEIVLEGGCARGVRAGQVTHACDAVVATLPLPLFRRLLPAAHPGYLSFLDKTRYLGLICPVMVLDRPLTGFWTLNITDDRIPFTGIIETTAYIDPQYVGGHHLIYLPKYTAPDSQWRTMPDEEIRATWLEHLEQMSPHFDRRWIRHFLVHREHYVEPLHGLNQADLIPPVQTPIENLYLATTAQIYPALTNGESVCRHARQCAPAILEASRSRAALAAGAN